MEKWEGEATESYVRKALGAYVDYPFYGVQWYVDQDTGNRSDPWLVWTPPDVTGAKTDADFVQDAVDLVEERILSSRRFSWSPFPNTDDGEIFTPAPFYGDLEARRSELYSVISRLEEGVRTVNNSVHPAEVGKLKALRNEARSRLDDHVDELWKYVLEPLKDALLPCLIESYRDLIGFGNWENCGHDARSSWRSVARRVGALWKRHIARGKPLENMRHVHELDCIPEPVSNGVTSALKSLVRKTYIPDAEARRERPTDRSRNGILSRAQPIYFKWIGAQLMVESALYDQDLKAALKAALEESELETEPFRTKKELLSEYEPSPDAEKLLNAIFELQSEGYELCSANSRSRAAIYTFVNNKRDLGIAAPRETLANDLKRLADDLKGVDVYDRLWPDDTAELIEIAQIYHQLT